ncbi:tRNA-dihydrouridine(20a/20b) synthase [NAD(P)+]-like [Amphibalanus amphitrite]|uniref:tRNA-dihydrouridine(20a/20b) synthase [NAD(P)+]-like n=1 Tax=Amphibalanus amphitrite TaxID=1232801 RepID=UPI001C91A92A|nr:tRNA-dihydrouridine(20a/20b) synthase [NAD(P)+]-like [Amphibalanus amphitrite]XP_043197735.1 tRNA-dihydrouridine(20a/20b) synthase [NAD(P)+]-like [Amphibalanus amphitrite]XP_043197736.1 tRNA-dihydrouridine(20a/20b) synthase [NAD(P)+]-like [Amphibalanus amphitrite]XP_043197737.1 tRNA-dihydrouridine(20a/20b) synthase [NAD(P)+]-like [Amphibalanus amphitrite]XP_043197738.1 tRNA-dihydrouridine(20a/20b) synthase [NAD(P)+]-like [Amphibalanus amphitrite]XP_043197739.1 tRNA-dihydrouridine(20a/20b) s
MTMAAELLPQTVDSIKPLEILCAEKPAFVCAPMVRYSKLAFRNLVRIYGCDIAFSPMIMSDSFVKSQKARDSEFTTNAADKPLIVQFAANNAADFACAAELVAKWCQGVDLNCGCPQRWAQQEGIGACLINKPQLVFDVVRQTRNRIADTDFTISVKIRVHKDIRETVELCRRAEAAGVSFISVHGRTISQRREPVDREAIAAVAAAVRVPVIANGDVRTLQDALSTAESTGAKGVMAAQGLLNNPALFSGAEFTPLSCVRDWLRLATDTGTPFTCTHHHLIYMLERQLPRNLRRTFNVLPSHAAVLEFLRDQLALDV